MRIEGGYWQTKVGPFFETPCTCSVIVQKFEFPEKIHPIHIKGVKRNHPLQILYTFYLTFYASEH